MTLKTDLPALFAREDTDLSDRFCKEYTGDYSLPSLNAYFRNLLTRAPISTLDERSCLLNELEPRIWLDYFTDHVFPTIIRFNLL